MDQKTKNQKLKAIVDAFIKQHGGRDALINSLRRNPRAVRASWENYLYQSLRNLPNITEDDYSTAYSYLREATYPAWDFAENNILHLYQDDRNRQGGLSMSSTSQGDDQVRLGGAGFEQAVVSARVPSGVRPLARSVGAAPKMVDDARTKEPQVEQVRQVRQGGSQVRRSGGQVR